MPVHWCLSMLYRVHKKDHSTLFKRAKYHRISLLDIGFKVVLARKAKSYRQLIDWNQSGFKPGNSTGDLFL